MTTALVEERADRLIQVIGNVVMASNLVVSLFVLASDCSAIFGLLLWGLTALAFVGCIALPVLVRLAWFTTTKRTVIRASLAAIAMTVPLILLYLRHYPHMGGCIA